MATYDEVFAGLSPHPLVISCLRVERKSLKMIKGGYEYNHENFTFQKKSKRIKGGNDHHHENAEHQILATRIYLIYMSVKYDFHRKNTVTLDHILAPNLNVQSCRQHQERKNLQSPPLEYADLPCPGCCTDSPSCPSPSPHPESYISNIPIFIIHKFDNQI